MQMRLPSTICRTRDKQSNLGGCTCLPMAQEAMPQVKLPVASLSKQFLPSIITRAEGDSPLVRLQQAFFAAHMRICEFAALHPEYAEMATTCTAVVVRGTRIWIAHIGDSRAYLVRASTRSRPTIARLTTDHSMVAGMVRAGELSPEQMRYSPGRDVFLRALGKSEENNPYPDFTMHEVRAGDALVLCSDGLWSAVTEDQIAYEVCTMPPQQACEELVRLANETGGDENISIIILSFSGTEGDGTGTVS